ncbi:MAG TPA: polyphenol oxidase family protein [Thermoanaerobaculia bacterium]|nr:polyphenol oxidase family protein [Thermoanaerobaculia bacterium]
MWRIEPSPLGRIVVPPFLPPRFALFTTTADFRGRLNAEEAKRITDFVRERFALDTSFNTCNQVHGVSVARATRESAWRECDSCDALWTDENGVSIGIKVADCLPVTMIDPTHHVLANVHSGWRGAAQGITSQTLDAVQHSTAFDTAEAFAYLGPSIRVCCFEVGDEVAAQFDAQYVDRSYDKAHIDLPRMTQNVLRARGIAALRIFDSELCTRCDGSIFHSFRRDREAGGRNLQIAAQ